MIERWRNWRFRRNCWHHDRVKGRSLITGHLINGGISKHYSCRLCGRYWTRHP